MLTLLCVSLVCWILWQTRQFSQREDEWRQRERQLIDRLLKQANVAPLEVKREEVLKLPDPEIPTRTIQDEAFRVDDILEDLELRHPDVAGMSPEAARALYPGEWRQLEQAWDEAHAPLRF